MEASTSNDIDFSFLDSEEKTFAYTVMIILNRPINKDLFLLLKNKSDYVICADGAANQVYDAFDLKNEKYDNFFY